MKKFIGIALALVLSLSVFAGCGSDSGSNEDSSKAKEKYVIATDTTFAPFEFTNDDNEFVGIDVDILAAIAKDQGFENDRRYEYHRQEKRNLRFLGIIL